MILECALPSTVQAGAVPDSPRYAMPVICTSCMLMQRTNQDMASKHKSHLQELYDPNQLQVQLDEQADSFINRQASACLPQEGFIYLLVRFSP